jgi:hypothetical protein
LCLRLFIVNLEGLSAPTILMLLCIHGTVLLLHLTIIFICCSVRQDTNWKLKMGLTKLALLWIPCSLLAVWVFPTISTVW